ncbi:MAG: polysaccharide deacetylase family protein [Planctomycetaceae bacterium]
MTSLSSPKRTLVSLALHDVTDDPASSGFRQPMAQKYKHTVAQFEQYLDAVQASGLRVITDMDEVSDEPAVIFTFDDGGACSLVPAAMLEERGWRGIFFITTDLLGTRGFLTREEVQELHRRGHVIGSHSCSHPDVFRSLNRAQMQYEWCNSVDILQSLTGEPCVVASIPGGDMNNMTIDEAAAAGLKHLFTSEQRTTPWQHADLTCYGRLFIMCDTQPRTLSRWLKHPAVGILPERTVRMTKTAVKKMMGPFYRRLVAGWRARHDQD